MAGLPYVDTTEYQYTTEEEEPQPPLFPTNIFASQATEILNLLPAIADKHTRKAIEQAVQTMSTQYDLIATRVSETEKLANDTVKDLQGIRKFVNRSLPESAISTKRAAEESNHQAEKRQRPNAAT